IDGRRRLRLFTIGLTGPVGIVIPVLVRGDLVTAEALRLLPSVTALRTDAAGPERVPDRAAARHASPAAFSLRPPLALRTVDLGLSIHRFTPVLSTVREK